MTIMIHSVGQARNDMFVVQIPSRHAHLPLSLDICQTGGSALKMCCWICGQVFTTVWSICNEWLDQLQWHHILSNDATDWINCNDTSNWMIKNFRLSNDVRLDEVALSAQLQPRGSPVFVKREHLCPLFSMPSSWKAWSLLGEEEQTTSVDDDWVCSKKFEIIVTNIDEQGSYLCSFDQQCQYYHLVDSMLIGPHHELANLIMNLLACETSRAGGWWRINCGQREEQCCRAWHCCCCMTMWSACPILDFWIWILRLELFWNWNLLFWFLK